MKRGVIFALVLIFLILIAGLILASHNFSPASFSASVNTESSYSITITNTDTDGAAPNIANITEVKITLPSGFTFSSGTNSTSRSAIFTNTPTTLTWTNSSFVVGSATNGENIQSFSFSATASSTGKYNLTLTTKNISGSFDQKIPVTITSGESLSITYASPTPDDNAELIVSEIEVNITATGDIKNITIFLFDSGRSKIDSYTSNSSPAYKIFESLSDGTYYINATAFDISGSEDSTGTRMITLNTSTACTPNWNCEDWSECVDNEQTRTCTDSNSCGTDSGKPNETQTCEVCVPAWNCTPWAPAECPESETQTRTCTDGNQCETITNKPAEEKTCEYKQKINWIFTLTVSALGLTAVTLLIYIIYFLTRGRNPQNEISQQGYSSYGNAPQGHTYKY